MEDSWLCNGYAFGFIFYICWSLIERLFLTLLQGLINNLISIGLGRESAFSAAVLGDNALMEKAWQDTGMLAEAVLHAHVSFQFYLIVFFFFLQFAFL